MYNEVKYGKLDYLDSPQEHLENDMKILKTTEEYVAYKMYEQFKKDSPSKFNKVRKQILKNQTVDYFKENVGDNKKSIRIITRCKCDYVVEGKTILTKGGLYNILKQTDDNLKVESNVGISNITVDIAKVHLEILENNIRWRYDLRGFD